MQCNYIISPSKRIKTGLELIFKYGCTSVDDFRKLYEWRGEAEVYRHVVSRNIKVEEIN